MQINMEKYRNTREFLWKMRTSSTATRFPGYMLLLVSGGRALNLPRQESIP